MTVVTIEPLDSFISIVIRDDLSAPAQSRAVAAFARVELAEAQRINARALGRTPKHVTFVDGRRDAALETVRPSGGSITFAFSLADDALRWIFSELRRRSPVVSGRYRDGHVVYADGRAIALTAIPPAAEYVFSNTVAYARRLEIGKTRAGRAFLVTVPNRIYERVAHDASRRFGNVAKITFAYPGGGRSKSRAPAIIVSNVR